MSFDTQFSVTAARMTPVHCLSLRWYDRTAMIRPYCDDTTVLRWYDRTVVIRPYCDDTTVLYNMARRHANTSQYDTIGSLPPPTCWSRLLSRVNRVPSKVSPHCRCRSVGVCCQLPDCISWQPNLAINNVHADYPTSQYAWLRLCQGVPTGVCLDPRGSTFSNFNSILLHCGVHRK